MSAISRVNGFSLLEFLIALLVFTTGLLGLGSASLTARKTTFESAQYSVATTMAADLLERIRANSSQRSVYLLGGAQGWDGAPGRPETDCQRQACTAAELAQFDLWQWHAALQGAATRLSDNAVPVLSDVRVCLTEVDGSIRVVLSWLGSTLFAMAASSTCGPDEPANDGEASRRQVMLSTYIPVQAP